jgi:UDP-glucose-4-epimerase GalE
MSRGASSTPRSLPSDSDDEEDVQRTPLRMAPEHDQREAPKWPWVALGFFVGLLAVLFVPPAGGGMRGDVGCGAVPIVAPPLVRRQMDGQAKNVLVTGGAGLIGSHFALALIDRKGFNVTVVDDLSRGSIETILRLQAIAEQAGEPFNFVRLDVNEEHQMVELLKRHAIDTVVHFGANAYVGESMVHPEDYYQNITASTVSIVRAMHRVGLTKLIFSSSCATFGAPTTFPITELTPQRPTNPYGQAKLQAEQAIVAFLRAQERAKVPFSAALLRYFNVVGADPQGRLGPHLSHAANRKYPRILDAAYDVALGLRPYLTVMGDSFPTKDKSAARDYIHVSDLVDAHVLLLYALRDNDLLYYNVGNGQPYTVRCRAARARGRERAAASARATCSRSSQSHLNLHISRAPLRPTSPLCTHPLFHSSPPISISSQSQSHLISISSQSQVLEIVEVVKKVSGKPLPVQISAARPGDPPTLYADPAKIKYELGWNHDGL